MHLADCLLIITYLKSKVVMNVYTVECHLSERVGTEGIRISEMFG